MNVTRKYSRRDNNQPIHVKESSDSLPPFPTFDTHGYEKDDTEAVESMEFINILNIDIKELKAKELDVTYEFDPSLDSSSELVLKSVFCCDFTSY